LRTLVIAMLVGLAWPILASGTDRASAQSQPTSVDPANLERRPDLVGKDVVVDGRVLYYQFHTGIGYDEIKLKNTDMVFRLPPRLRPVGTPGTKPVIVQGQLTRVSGQLVVNVKALRVMPDDAARLDQEVARLAARDVEGRKAWAAWAEKRSKDYGDRDGVLLQRAGALRTEALRLEAAQTRGTVDAPSEWLALAEDARRRKVPAPEPEALVHRALQARLTAASKAADLDEIRSLVERYFPRAASDAEAGRLNLGQWEQAYSADPFATYRNPRLSADLRRALDRRLWADVMVKRFEIQAQTDPLSALNLASEAETELPDRPKFAEMLLNKGLEAARQNVGNLRRDEVRSMGQAYRDKLHNPQAELELYRGWLKIQRDRLSDTDADGPVELAARYEEFLQDHTTARELLDRAWKIDPGSKQIAEAFRTRGYQRVGDRWVEAVPGTGGTDPAGAPKDDAPVPSSRGLLGRIPDEVIQQMGSKPDSKVLSATKGQLIEQWIFHLPARKDRYVNFLRTPGDVQPRVVSDHVIERRISGER
jgi:tetratricopeptide (TPR) repeat protein